VTSSSSSRRGREPRLIAFNAYVNEDGNEVAIVRVHPDVDSMEFHMKVIREHVEHAAMEFLGGVVSEHIYGAVSDTALEMMRLRGRSRPEVMSHGIGGFTRSAAEPAAVRQ
jgi:hypothetical protein